jgi:hypothetical protein
MTNKFIIENVFFIQTHVLLIILTSVVHCKVGHWSHGVAIVVV